MNINPPPILAERQNIVDAEHLRLLSIFHYVVGGISALFGSMFLFHVVIGLTMANHAGPFGKFLDEQAQAARANRLPTASASPAAPAEPGGDGQLPGAEIPAPARSFRQQGPDFPPFFGYMMAGMGAFAVLTGWTSGALMILSGISIARRRRRTFSLVVAGLSCLFFPFGTVLGVFTFLVLLRPTVEWSYRQPRQPDGVLPPAPPPLSAAF